jgi:hypothetical protein
MALTPEDKKKIMKMLDEVDRNILDKILASLNAFCKWLQNELYDIFIKIGNALNDLWDGICDFFS